jgi:hypothetical protein
MTYGMSEKKTAIMWIGIVSCVLIFIGGLTISAYAPPGPFRTAMQECARSSYSTQQGPFCLELLRQKRDDKSE